MVDQTGSSLIINNITGADEGSYRVTVTVGGGSATSAPFFVDVIPAGALPLAGGLGIAVLAGACAMAGGVVIRRKR